MEDPKHTKERMDERLAMMHKLYSDSEVKHFFSPSEPMTNADRIRAMTDEELAEFLLEESECPCYGHKLCIVEDDVPCEKILLKWLKQEATE